MAIAQQAFEDVEVGGVAAPVVDLRRDGWQVNEGGRAWRTCATLAEALDGVQARFDRGPDGWAVSFTCRSSRPR